MTHDRMPPLPDAHLTPEQRQAVAAFRAARGGDPTGPFVALLRSPEVLNRTRALGDHVRFHGSLPSRLSEFAILLVAREWRQHFEWDYHCPLALEAGLHPDVTRAVFEGRRPVRMAEDEARLYAFVTELQQARRVSDATYAAVAGMFGERGVIDLVGIVGYYSLLAMVMNTAQTPRLRPDDPSFT